MTHLCKDTFFAGPVGSVTTQHIFFRVLCEDAAMIGTQLYTLHDTPLFSLSW